jgi:hypothetical protein
MDNVLVINLTTLTQHVGVIHADGRSDSVQIMPRRRVHLRTGMTVDPRWLGLNPTAVRVQKPEPQQVQRQVVPAPEVVTAEPAATEATGGQQ